MPQQYPQPDWEIRDNGGNSGTFAAMNPDSLEKQLKRARMALEVLMEQKAGYGLRFPVDLGIEIKEKEAEIADLEAKLGSAGAAGGGSAPATGAAPAGATIYNIQGSVGSIGNTGTQQNVAGTVTGNQRNANPPQAPAPKPVTPQNFVEDLSLGASLEMLWIPRGDFIMGASKKEPESLDSERPQHLVSVPGFYMGKFPITQAQWHAVAVLPPVERTLDPEPSMFDGEERPVERVFWDDAAEFCARLSRETGKTYRLPSEAEWEYACRAGTKTPYYFGDAIAPEQANFGRYSAQTSAVGSYAANASNQAFGLHDMHGNVWEWCADDWHGSYKGAPVDGSALCDREDAPNKVIRGGSWYGDPRWCRSALRNYVVPGFRYISVGFRVCCSAPRT